MIDTRDVFRLIGLEEDWNAAADQQPGYIFKDDQIEITINLNTGLSFRQTFSVMGFARNARSLKQVVFDFPSKVSSVESALILFAEKIGHDYISYESAPWLQLGKKWKDVQN